MPAATKALKSGEILVFVKDAEAGKLGILVGEREIVLHNPAVTAAILLAVAQA